MTDPRYTDPRNDPVLRDDANIGGTWGWIAGLAILALIAFVVVAGWNSDRHTAGNNPSAPMSTSSAPRAMPPRYRLWRDLAAADTPAQPRPVT